MKINFEEDLLSLEKRVESIEFATDFYNALCNMRWQSTIDSSKIYSCSWRYAGRMIAELRNRGEEYLDFYCSGSEGVVKPYIELELKKLGWKPLPWENIEC